MSCSAVGSGTAAQLWWLVGHICPHTSTAPSLPSHTANSTWPHRSERRLRGPQSHPSPAALTTVWEQRPWAPSRFLFSLHFRFPTKLRPTPLSQQALTRQARGEGILHHKPHHCASTALGGAVAATAGTFLSRPRGRLHQASGLGFLPKQFALPQGAPLMPPAHQISPATGSPPKATCINQSHWLCWCQSAHKLSPL